MLPQLSPNAQNDYQSTLIQKRTDPVVSQSYSSVLLQLLQSVTHVHLEPLTQ